MTSGHLSDGAPELIPGSTWSRFPTKAGPRGGDSRWPSAVHDQQSADRAAFVKAGKVALAVTGGSARRGCPICRRSGVGSPIQTYECTGFFARQRRRKKSSRGSAEVRKSQYPSSRAHLVQGRGARRQLAEEFGRFVRAEMDKMGRAREENKPASRTEPGYGTSGGHLRAPGVGRVTATRILFSTMTTVIRVLGWCSRREHDPWVRDYFAPRRWIRHGS